MEILRKVKIDPNGKIKVGDQVQLGPYTATCQKVLSNRAIFMFDQLLESRITLAFDSYDEWMKYLFKFFEMWHTSRYFDKIRDEMIPFRSGEFLRLPLAEEMFGCDNTTDYAERLSYCKQWPLMKNYINRIGLDKKGCAFYCLKNKYTRTSIWNVSERICVISCGEATYVDVGYNDDVGVRPVFQIKR